MNTKRLLVLTLMMAGAVMLQPQAGVAGANPDKPVVPNRTLPKVNPPKTGLEFSATPTTQEIISARVFEESLVPMGGEPSADENAALAAALLEYAKRNSPDDFSSLAKFLEKHPKSPWRAALLTSLGIEYYNTAYYSRALEAWQEAWSLSERATELRGKFVADRAVCELAGLYSRLGRTAELAALLQSVEQRGFLGGADERINIVKESLWRMRTRPDVSFRCGPLALQSVKRALDPQSAVDPAIRDSVSTPSGFSLPEVAELSKKVGLNYQMAFRDARSSVVVPSVVHWKAGHYAAIVRQVGDRYLLHDPTFGNNAWASKQALDSEASGYFLIPTGDLPQGWRAVEAQEGLSIHGKGETGIHDPDRYTPDDLATTCGPSTGMAVSSVHLMLANLQIRDTPVGYTPPVGPAVHFTVRYNQRDYLQPPSLGTSPFGPRWTHDWNEAIKEDPNSPLGDVKVLAGGGGAHSFMGAGGGDGAASATSPGKIKKMGTNTYELIYPDGSKKVFGLRLGISPIILLTQVVDPAGNAVTLVWDSLEGIPLLRALVDAIGQVTTIGYENQLSFQIVAVADPFGRVARFGYVEQTLRYFNGSVTNFVRLPMLTSITDVLGLSSHFAYRRVDTDNLGRPVVSDQIVKMTTPYGDTTFTTTETNIAGGIRVVETTFPDGSRDRVEFNQSITNIALSEPEAIVPSGMPVANSNLRYRNTYYWSRTACASSYGDYSKAKIYHWLHLGNFGTTAGILESTKEALENRVWYHYGQFSANIAGTQNRATHIGRVLDDGQTQLYRYGYNGLRNLTNSVDPLGRTLSYLYASNEVDLLEVRQTRAGNNELLFSATYNGQHRPLATVSTDGQTNTYTYNARGQVLTETSPRGETTSSTYDADGYLIAVDGPLPGTNDLVRITYDAFGRARTLTGIDGYSLTFDYDEMDRVTKITHPDATFEQFTFDRLDMAAFQDRAGRSASYEHDNMRQVRKRTDPLGRVTLYDWCRCGQIKSLTDPMGRTTSWFTDVQGRNIAKQYSDGSQVTYQYEKGGGRLRQVIDEKQQGAEFTYNRDDTLRATKYFNTSIPTPGVSYTYDTNYQRILSMTDGTGTTRYSYNPITSTPTSGAGALAGVDGPLPNDTVSYGYDELGRLARRAINGVDFAMSYDGSSRLTGVTNALGSFSYDYDGTTARRVSKSLPNGQTEARNYGNNLQDRTLQRITHRTGATALSEFLYGHNAAAGRITTWSQQAGAQSPSLHTFGYDAVNQLLSAAVTNAGNLVTVSAYSYDSAANRLTEQVGASNNIAVYNALNEISATTVPGRMLTNEWDALDRLVAVNTGTQRTEFTYDGLSRRVAIRQLVNGVEVSLRRFVWCGSEICEERDAAGVVTKRFFGQGMKVERGQAAGRYDYTRDHLGSIRELTDDEGNVRARYAYDSYGRRTKVAGDLEADFGFAGMFWSPEVNLSLTQFRAYDPELGRWLSRDPLANAELTQGPNLYAYVFNDPVNRVDRLGLFSSLNACFQNPAAFTACVSGGIIAAKDYAREVAQRGWQGLVRAGSFVKDCFSRSPSTQALPASSPSQVSATSQTIQTLESAPVPVLQSQSLPGIGTAVEQAANTGLHVSTGLQRTLPAARTMFEAAENEAWANEWFFAMVRLNDARTLELLKGGATSPLRDITLRYDELLSSLLNGL